MTTENKFSFKSVIADRLTILIVTWKRDDLLKDCLDSIVQSTNGKSPKTVVVDNADQQSTKALCAKYPFVVSCSSKENLGFAGGNNLGLLLCNTEYILLLNNETIIVEEPFSAMIKYADDNPQVGVVSGKLWMGNDWPQGTLNGAGGFLTKWGIVYSPAFLGRDCEDFCHPKKVFTAGGALMLVRRSAIERAGGNLFYDHFKSYYEEVDFCHRVWITGGEVHFIPSPKVIHISGKTTGMFSYSAILKQYYRNIFFSHMVNFGFRGFLQVTVPFLFLYCGSMLVRLVKGKFSQVAQMFDVFRILWSERKKIRETRRKVQNLRIRRDGEIFSQTMKPLPLSVFLKMVGMQ